MAEQPEIFVTTIADISAGGADLILANLFGKPCAKLDGGKPFLSYFQDCMVYKLGAVRAQELIAENTECQLFDPSGKGRPFKDWVQVPEGTGLDWIALGHEALALQNEGKNV